MEIILKIASILTAITVIAGAVKGLIRLISNFYKFMRKIETKIDNFDENLKENTLSTLRLVIINEDMPLPERLKARCKILRTRRKWRNTCTL